MLEYIEVVPPPAECENCEELDCGECDVAGLRWVLTKRSELELKRKMKIKEIERFQRELAEIDRQLLELTD